MKQMIALKLFNIISLECLVHKIIKILNKQEKIVWIKILSLYQI